MEDVIEVYHRPYDPLMPVICMDESNKQLVSHTQEPLPSAPSKPLKVDDEYVRHGVADIFMAIEPMGGRRIVSVTERRTRVDWAVFMRDVMDKGYPDANMIVLIMDNLNTHGLASFYEAFPPDEAYRLASRLEIHYTPKHGNWLNLAEVELSALVGQCLDRRVSSMETMRREIAAWERDRNNKGVNITWRFTAKDARVKLRRLYQKF